MRVSVVVIGAGQAGLAMSRHLTAGGLDHVVLEQGEVANSWRTERWDSLRLLTPNWMTRMPGDGYQGDHPDGFATASEVVSFLDAYRQSLAGPVLTGVTVTGVTATDAGFDVVTDHGRWECDAVVAATGGSSVPRIPSVAADVPHRIDQLTALHYRRPGQLDASGEVLVVGASASGVQIADELQRSGRQVTIAVGEHVRLPRMYRGRDIYWWMDAIGQLDERYDEVADIERARRHASVQLVGTVDRVTLDLNTLSERGVRLVGKLMRITGGVAQFSGSLANLVANADLKQTRLLNRIDEFSATAGLDGEAGVIRPRPTQLGSVPTELKLSGYSAVIWATGYRPTYPWLDPAAFDHRHRVVHDGGVARLDGLYLLGLPFMRRRRSNLISGVGTDAAELLGHLRRRLDDAARQRSHLTRPSQPLSPGASSAWRVR